MNGIIFSELVAALCEESTDGARCARCVYSIVNKSSLYSTPDPTINLRRGLKI